MRGGVKERAIRASRDGNINQDCGGIKIGGWRSGKMEENGVLGKCIQRVATKSLQDSLEK